jgi:DNA-binding LytR/AlgR family response regulator
MNILIIDDEPLFCKRLRLALLKIAGVSQVHAVRSTEIEAELSRSPHQIDIVIVDSGESGASYQATTSQFAPSEAPIFIFTSLFEHFANQAIHFRAFDFLPKPVDEVRLAETIALAATRISEKQALLENSELQLTLASLRKSMHEFNSHKTSKSLWINDRGRRFRVQTDQIEWIEAERDYVRIHLGQNRSVLMRSTMAYMESLLDAALFLRAHRSAIVNVEQISQTQLQPTGGRILQMTSGAQIRVGRTFERQLSRHIRHQA